MQSNMKSWDATEAVCDAASREGVFDAHLKHLYADIGALRNTHERISHLADRILGPGPRMAEDEKHAAEHNGGALNELGDVVEQIASLVNRILDEVNRLEKF